MDTGHSLDLFDLVNDINTDVNTLFLLILRSLHALDDIICHIHAWNKFLHISSHTKGLWWCHTGQNIDLIVKPQVANHLHELGKFLYIVDNLSLDKISTGRDLLAQTYSTILKGIGKGVRCSTQKELRFGLLDGLPALKALLVAHLTHHAQHLNGVHVKDALGAGMVPKLLVITSEAEQIL